MKRAGYDYADIWKAGDDRRWMTPAVTPGEIQTAVADVTCKQQANMASVWLTVETAYQKREIEKRAEDFRDLREFLDRQIRAANQVAATDG